MAEDNELRYDPLLIERKEAGSVFINIPPVANLNH